MTRLLICSILALSVACSSKPDPTEEVRINRRLYEITNYPFAASNETSVLTYEFMVQNQAGTLALHDLTVIAQGYDKDSNVIWKKTHTLDVSNLGKHATETFTFQETLENISELDAFQVVLAPDDESAPWNNYKEFIRAGGN